MTTTSRPPRLPSSEVLYEIVMRHNRILRGELPDPREPPKYDGPTCSHGNPLGNCFDCEE